MILTLVISVLLSFLLSFFSIPSLIKVAIEKGMFDVPSKRKMHFKPIPAFGGIVFFASVILSVSIFAPMTESKEIQYFIAASIPMFFIGLKDDILVISASKKFIGQLFAVFILVYFGGFQISSLNGFLGIYELDPIISTVFSFLTMLMIINAFNLIDGVNGLAGSLALVSMLFFGSFFVLKGNLGYSVIALTTAASITAFLFYNITPARIFMGDTGSLFLGLVNSVLVVQFIKSDFSTINYLHITETAAMGMAAMFVPLMDTLRIFSIRLMNGRSPFDPDANHIHHLLLARGMSHTKVTLMLTFLAISGIILAYFLQPLGIHAIIIGLFFLGSAFILYSKSIHVPLNLDITKFKSRSSIENQVRGKNISAEKV